MDYGKCKWEDLVQIFQYTEKDSCLLVFLMEWMRERRNGRLVTQQNERKSVAEVFYTSYKETTAKNGDLQISELSDIAKTIF